jgi:hypothetical protein
MRTPIELLIYQLQYRYNVDPNPVLLLSIEAAIALLPHEKEIIKTAYLSGRAASASNQPYSSQDSNNYYIQTFTKP